MMMCRVDRSVSIPGRFNGPLTSGNGGYCAGVFAGLIPDPVAEVSLRRPVPLDTALEVAPGESGALQVLDGDALIAEARPAREVEVEVPAPVSVAEAREAATRYRGRADGPFCKCFICGRERPDAFGVFAGAVADRPLVASPWTPATWTAGADGVVAPEFVWSVLDCPTYFASYPDDLPLSVLARLTARLDGPVAAGEEHVVIAWPIEVDGRKRHAGSAVLTADGSVLAVARALLVEPR